jgi:hypothetical protein
MFGFICSLLPAAAGLRQKWFVVVVVVVVVVNIPLFNFLLCSAICVLLFVLILCYVLLRSYQWGK